MTKWRYFAAGLAIGYFLNKYKVEIHVIKIGEENA